MKTYEWIEMVCSGSINDLMTALTGALVGALVGAFLAFRLERLGKRDDEKNKKVVSGNATLFAMTQFWQAVTEYKRQVVNQVVIDGGEWINMAATASPPEVNSTIQTQRLEFLLGSNDGNVLNQVLLEERRFQTLSKWIEMRNNLLFSHAYPSLEDARIQRGSTTWPTHMENAVGQNITHQLKELTKGIIAAVEEDIKSFEETFDRLRAALKNQFPNEKFIKFTFMPAGDQSGREVG